VEEEHSPYRRERCLHRILAEGDRGIRVVEFRYPEILRDRGNRRRVDYLERQEGLLQRVLRVEVHGYRGLRVQVRLKNQTNLHENLMDLGIVVDL